MKTATWDIGSAWRPLHGENKCGDVIASWWENTQLFLALADGLGHGNEANYAAEFGIECLKHQACLPLIERVLVCDELLRKTRGIALGLACIDTKYNLLTFLGIGNIRGIIIGNGYVRRLVCGNGIVGAGFDKPFLESIKLISGYNLIITSDGIQEQMKWRPCITAQAAAETLLTEFALARDDAAVLVCRYNCGQSPSAKAGGL